ncbi:MAG: hypothetical protein RR550_04010 [Rikenellaceae bacterium]
MKKLLLLFSLMLCSMVSMAQVQSFNGTLKEALAKGKAENKPILLFLTIPNG